MHFFICLQKVGVWAGEGKGEIRWFSRCRLGLDSRIQNYTSSRLPWEHKGPWPHGISNNMICSHIHYNWQIHSLTYNNLIRKGRHSGKGHCPAQICLSQKPLFFSPFANGDKIHKRVFQDHKNKNMAFTLLVWFYYLCFPPCLPNLVDRTPAIMHWSVFHVHHTHLDWQSLEYDCPSFVFSSASLSGLSRPWTVIANTCITVCANSVISALMCVKLLICTTTHETGTFTNPPHRWGDWGTVRSSYIPKVAQLLSIRAGTQTSIQTLEPRFSTTILFFSYIYLNSI